MCSEMSLKVTKDALKWDMRGEFISVAYVPMKKIAPSAFNFEHLPTKTAPTYIAANGLLAFF